MKGLLLAACLLLACVPAQAQEVTVYTVAEDLPLDSWQRAVDSLAGEGRVDVRELLYRMLQREEILSADEALRLLLEALRQAVLDRRGLMLRLLAPALLCGLLARLREAFAASSVAEVCHWVCYLWVATAIVRECVALATLSRQAVDGMATGMQALFPLLLTLLAAVGGTSSAAFFQPAVVAAKRHHDGHLPLGELFAGAGVYGAGGAGQYLRELFAGAPGGAGQDGVQLGRWA